MRNAEKISRLKEKDSFGWMKRIQTGTLQDVTDVRKMTGLNRHVRPNNTGFNQKVRINHAWIGSVSDVGETTKY